MYKVNDLEFQGHAMEIEQFNYHHWIPWPRNYTHEKFHKKFGREDQNPGGLQQPPPL